MDLLDGLEEKGLDLSSVLLASEVLERYVLTWVLGERIDGDAECTVLVLMKREDGLLLVVPDGFLPMAVIERGNAGDEGAIFGPSKTFQVPAVLMDGGIVSRTGGEVSVLVVDCLPGVLQHMRRFGPDEEIIYGYDEDSPFAFPMVDALIPLVRRWLQEQPDLGAFYTPDDVEGDLEDAPNTPGSRRKGPPRKGTPTVSGPKLKRPTTASLAADLQAVVETLPKFSEQLSMLAQRQTLVESRLAPVPEQQDALARPTLSASLTVPRSASLGALAKSVGAPPRTTSQANHGLLPVLQDSRPLELQELEDEKPAMVAASSLNEGGPLAQAMLEQTKALSLLVAQIAQSSSDPMADLSMTSAPAGSRGAAGRARLQAELSAHRGTFFTAVMHSMARRMSPTSSVDVAPSALMDRGISGVRYLERFGGYNRQRELGQLQFQVMTAFDFLMADNIPAAKDTIALLAVSIEQSCLDNGRMDLATLLCLQEDPPASIFTNRQLSATSRARSFSPLADQKWVTVALAFLKELEVINQKRTELTSPPKPLRKELWSLLQKPRTSRPARRKETGKEVQPRTTANHHRAATA